MQIAHLQNSQLTAAVASYNMPLKNKQLSATYILIVMYIL